MPYESLETNYNYNSNEPLGRFHSYSPYSKSAERNDIYGGMAPNTDMVYGNLYRKGMSVNEAQIGQQPYRNETDISLREFEDPFEEQEDTSPTPKRRLTEQKKKEKFTTIGTDDDQEVTPIDGYDEIESTTDKRKKRKYDVYVKIFLLIVFFLGIAYWLKTTENVLQKYFFKDVQVQWYHLLLIATMLTLVFIFVLHMMKFDIDLIKRKE